MQTQTVCKYAPAATGHSLKCSPLFKYFFLPSLGLDSLDARCDFYQTKRQRSCSDSTALRFNLQRFIDVQDVAAVCLFYCSLLLCCWRGPLVNEMLLLLEMTCIRVKLIISHDRKASRWRKKTAFSSSFLSPYLSFFPTPPNQLFRKVNQRNTKQNKSNGKPTA